LPVSSYRYETWPLTLGEEHRLRVLGKRMLRKIFEHTWEDVTADWWKLHNEKPHDLYSSPNNIGVTKSAKRGGLGIWHICRKREVQTRFWWGNLRKRDHL
jgi:hypothetical protein